MRNIIVNNYLILSLALIIGVLTAGPAFYFHYFEPAYQGIEVFGSDAEDAYAAQIREIYDGHWGLGNVYWADQKDQPYVQQPLAPMIVAFTGKALGLSAAEMNLASKFIFPFLLTFVVYAFFASVTRRKDWALAMAAFVMLTQASWVFLDPRSWFSVLLKGVFPGTDSSFLLYSRPINPQISSFFFFGYLLCVWKFLFDYFSEKSERIYGAASAIILGLSLYVYIFTASFLFVFTGFLFLWFLYKKDRLKIRKLFLIIGGAILVGMPFFINLWAVYHSPFYGRMAQISGLVEGRNFIFSKLWWGVLALFLLGYRRWDWFKTFVLVFWAASFFVTNQQLITGRMIPVPAHYHWYYIAPVGGAILIYLFLLHAEKFFGLIVSRLMVGFLLIAFIYSGFMFQRNSYLSQRNSWVGLQRYAPVLFWIDKNMPKNKVIFSNESLSDLLTIYTGFDVYYNDKTTNFLIDPDRIKEIFHSYLFLDGVTKDKAKEFFYENRDIVGGLFFGQYYRYKNGCYGCFDDQILDSLILDYQDFLNKDFLQQLSKYPVDYIIWDKNIDSSWELDRFFNEKVYESGNIIIYKI